VLEHFGETETHDRSSWTGFVSLGCGDYESLKFTVTVMITGTGTPFSSVGE